MFVPEDLKDNRYWSRRTKNNVAAKRSREARRVKENQIALRAAYLERENEKLVGKSYDHVVCDVTARGVRRARERETRR